MNGTTKTWGLKNLTLAAAMAGVLASNGAEARVHAAAPVASITIPDRLGIDLTLAGPLSSEFNRAGDTFRLFVSEPIKVDGRIVIRAGTSVTGTVTIARPCGRLSKQGRLGIELGAISVGDRQLPLMPLHSAALSDKDSGLHGTLHAITSPVRELTNNVIAGLGDAPSPLQTPHRLDDPKPAASIKDDVLHTDPLDPVEFTSELGAQIARRGMVGAERVATNAVNFVFGGGPLALLKRGAAIELAPGTTVHAMILAAN